jgi:hypothetical protein
MLHAARTLWDAIPIRCKRGFPTIDLGQKGRGLDDGILQKATLAPVADAKESARRFRRKAIADVW